MSVPVRSNQAGTAVATVEQPVKSFALKSKIAELLQSDAAKAVIGPLVPAGVDYDLVIAEVYRAGTNDPKILKCTPLSIINAVAQVVQSGLTIGKTIYLVPQRTKISERGQPDEYEERLQAWTDYRGDIEMVVRSGAARFVDGHPVYEHEPYRVTLGTQPNVEHSPIMDTKKRGRLIGGYAYAILPGNLVKVFPMTLEEIEDVRAKSRSWKHLPVAPPWYVIKTCIHRVTKTLPKNPALAKVLALMERQETEDLDDGGMLSLGLDPAKQIGAPSSAGVEARSQSPATTEASATHAPTGERTPYTEDRFLDEPAAQSSGADDWRPGVDELPARTRSALELFPMPFGPTVGQPMGDLSTADLTSAYRWAMKNRNHAEFVAKAAQLLDDRNNGDAMEPTKIEPTA